MLREKLQPGDKCFQRVMREDEAAKDWREQDTVIDYDLPIAINAKEANEFIRRYEWLQTPGHPLARYGSYTAYGELAAVALFGKPTLNSATLYPDIDPNTVVCLERGACASWAHPHTGTWFLPRVLEQANKDHGWKAFYAYSDEEAGEIGTIYQASNWLYIGQGVGRPMQRGKPRERCYFRNKEWPLDRWIGSRQFFRRGLTIADTVDELEPDNEKKLWVRRFTAAKHKYVQFVGDKRERRAFVKALSVKTPCLPYPKRPKKDVDIPDPWD